jgi:hypothetical protein
MAMTNQQYHAAIRQRANALLESHGPHLLTVSEETEDGGKAGVICEVSALIGATLLQKKLARLATPEETTAYRANVAVRLRQNLAHKAALDIKTNTLQQGLLKLAAADFTVNAADAEMLAGNAQASAADSKTGGKGGK